MYTQLKLFSVASQMTKIFEQLIKTTKMLKNKTISYLADQS